MMRGGGTLNTTGITCDLAKTGLQDFGLLGTDRISGFEDVQGGQGGDRLFGTGGSNFFVANGGKDVLNGRGGADTFLLFEDVLVRDVIVYNKITDSGTGLSPANIDMILEFDRGGTATDDRIDLRAIDANPNKAGNQAFVLRGTGNFTSPAGEVRLVEGVRLSRSISTATGPAR
jgi:Ca2+-binding RTX toxin-like protein